MEKQYCAAPWRGLHINFRGDVKTCCAGDPNLLGDLNHHTMADILHGEKMREIRISIKNGKLHPEYCHNCIQAERYGRSERNWHNDVNPDFDASLADLDDHRPSIIDVRWNITCNLSCNYCGPYCSSKWAALMGEKYVNGARPYYNSVCDYINFNRSHVREVALVGGEPLLLPENETLLEVIPDDAIVTLITNMNVDFDSNTIVAKLKGKNRVGWSMSFDNVSDRFEYVRSGGAWSLTDRNVRTVVGFMKDLGHWGGIHAVYNLYSATHLCELRRYANEVGVNILWQTLYQPDYLDPMLLGTKVRDLCLEKIHQYQREFDLTDSEKDFFENVVNRWKENRLVSDQQISRLRQHIQDIETKYHRRDLGRFSKLWPELAFLSE